MDSLKTIYSSVQPSGMVTLGNYLGALKNWIKLQDDFKCIFSLADLHAITVRQNPKEFYTNTLNAYALFLACGINPEKSIFFIQSHVSAHAELAWILECYTQFGELSRMTQFKDKSQRYSDNINAGLFSYPALMAADILLYNPDLVPVGEDQKQHVELTRDIAQRFNGIYADTFVIPKTFTPKYGSRIMSLQDPTKKMSKSDSNLNSFISILDNPDDIVKKLKKAVTDSYSSVKYREGEKTGINNLLNIYCSITGKSLEESENIFEGKGYGTFKNSVSEVIIEEFRPIRTKFSQIIKDTDYIEKCYKKAGVLASNIACKTLESVMKKIGFIAR